MVTSPWLRARVLGALYKLTVGAPSLDVYDMSYDVGRMLNKREVRLLEAAGEEDLALLNALLALEAATREEQFDALERMLVYCQFEEGELSDRVAALPDRAFARAAFELYALGWVTPEEGA